MIKNIISYLVSKIYFLEIPNYPVIFFSSKYDYFKLKIVNMNVSSTEGVGVRGLISLAAICILKKKHEVYFFYLFMIFLLMYTVK